MIPIILAAGASTRMARPKALLDFDGKRAIDLILDTCAEAKLQTPVIVLGHDPDIAVPRGTVVVNRDWELGQTSSLKCGLKAAGFSTMFLLWPVDCPLVRAADLRALVDAYYKAGFVEKTFIPSHDRRRGHPVLFHSLIARDLLAIPDDEPARTVFNRHAIAYVEVDAPFVLMDMDTPEDYARLLEAYRTWKSRAR